MANTRLVSAIVAAGVIGCRRPGRHRVGRRPERRRRGHRYLGGGGHRHVRWGDLTASSRIGATNEEASAFCAGTVQRRRWRGLHRRRGHQRQPLHRVGRRRRQLMSWPAAPGRRSRRLSSMRRLGLRPNNTPVRPEPHPHHLGLPLAPSTSTDHRRTGSSPKGEGLMTTRGKTALVLAGLAVAAGVAAPTAAARPTCQSTDFKSICQTNGSVSIKARPGTVAPPANIPHMPFIGIGGRGRRR